MINKLKEYVLLREIALEHDYIPDFLDMTLEEVLECIDVTAYSIDDFRIRYLIQEHTGWQASDIESKVFALIKEADE